MGKKSKQYWAGPSPHGWPCCWWNQCLWFECVSWNLMCWELYPKFVFVGIWRYFFRRLSGLDKTMMSSHPPPRRGRHVTCWLSHHMNAPPHCAPAMKTHKMLSSDSWTIYRLWIPILCKGCSLKLLLHGLKLKGSIEQPNQKMAKELNWGEIQMASRSLQSCSIPIAVGEMWIKIALPFSHQSQNGCLPVKKWW